MSGNQNRWLERACLARRANWAQQTHLKFSARRGGWRPVAQVLPFVITLALVPLSVKGAHLTCEADLKSFRVISGNTNSPAEFSCKVEVKVDLSSRQWLIAYQDNGFKFALSHDDVILEKPNYNNASNTWYIVSSHQSGFPVDLDFDERMLWFAYCSKDYARVQNGRSAPLLYGDPRFDSYVHGCRMEVLWRSEFDVCPEEAVFLFDSDLFKDGVKKLAFEPPGELLNNRKKQFDNYLGGHTNNQLIARFRVNTWTNVANTGFPLSWTHDLYWYGDLAIVCFGSSEGVNVSDASMETKKLSQTARVSDRRIKTASLGFNEVNYSISNGQIPSLEEAKRILVEQNQKFDASGRAQMPQPSPRARLVLIALVVFSALSVVAAFWFWKPRGRES